MSHVCVCVERWGGNPLVYTGGQRWGGGGRGPEESANVLCLRTVKYFWCVDMCLRLLLQALYIVVFMVSIF